MHQLPPGPVNPWSIVQGSGSTATPQRIDFGSSNGPLDDLTAPVYSTRATDSSAPLRKKASLRSNHDWFHEGTLFNMFQEPASQQHNTDANGNDVPQEDRHAASPVIADTESPLIVDIPDEAPTVEQPLSNNEEVTFPQDNLDVRASPALPLADDTLSAPADSASPPLPSAATPAPATPLPSATPPQPRVIMPSLIRPSRPVGFSPPTPSDNESDDVTEEEEGSGAVWKCGAAANAPEAKAWIKLNAVDDPAPTLAAPSPHLIPAQQQAPTTDGQHQTVMLSELLMSSYLSRSQPYKVRTLVAPAGGEMAVEAMAEIDNGAMQIIVGAAFYEANVHVFGPLEPSSSHAQMADGRLRPFEGSLTVDINVLGVRVETQALVLRGSYDMLLGKPWCHLARAIHLYDLDWIYLVQPSHPDGPFIFVPNADSTIGCTGVTMSPIEAITMLAQQGVELEPGKPTRLSPDQLRLIKVKAVQAAQDQWADVAAMNEYASPADADEYLDVVHVRRAAASSPSSGLESNPSLTPERLRKRQEWQPYHLFGTPQLTDERLSSILQAITFGDDLLPGQRSQLEDLVRRHHAVFGLSAADLASNRKIVFDIELESNARCPSLHVRDPRLTPDDKLWLWDYCHKLLDVGIMRRVPPEQVTWLSDIKIVPKDKGHWACHDIDGALDLANDALRKAQLPFDPTRKRPAPVAPSQWQGPSGRRLVHNYIPLNRCTKNVVPYPVGAMEQKVSGLAGKRYYSSFDMLLGYFAIEASERAQQYLTFFVEGIGHLTYTRMPFGPVEGPARFNVLGNAAFGPLEQADPATAGGSFMRWMDDLNIASDTFEDHLRLLETLLELCSDCGITLSAKKTSLGVAQVRWCGNVISAKGVSSDPAKVEAVVRWGPLTCPMDVLRFINTASFLRSRIPDFAAITAPLTALSSLVDVPDGVGRRRGTRRQALLATPRAWRWTDVEEKSVALTKAAVAFAIASTPPDFSKFWFVDVDASPEALGAALLQPGEGRERLIIAVASKKCSPAESKASQFLREFMAIRFALDRFDQYIKGGRIVVTTDCIGLRDLLNSKDLSSTYVRWRESLLNYNIVRFVHRPGKGNLLCDGLSRKPLHGEDVEDVKQTWEERAGLAGPDVSWSESLPTGLVTTSAASISHPHAQLTVALLQRLATQDFDRGRPHPASLAIPFTASTTGVAPTAKPATPNVDLKRVGSDTEGKRLFERFQGDAVMPILRWLLLGELDEQVAKRGITRRLAKGYFLQSGQLFYYSRSSGQVLTVIPATEGAKLALQYHQSEGHYGRDRVALRARKDGWYWMNMKSTIDQALASCTTCQSCAPRKAAELTGPVIYPQPFDLVAMDFVKCPAKPASLPGQGDQGYICVSCDYQSHFLWAVRVPPTAAGAAQALRHLAFTCATPRRVLTDNGSHFTGKDFQEACASLGVAHTTSPVYAPWSNGLVERNNGELISQLRKLCTETQSDNWPDLLDVALSNVNRRVLASVGFSPQELLYGTIQWGSCSAAAAGLLPLEPDAPLPPETIEVRQTLLELQRDGVTQQRIDSIPEQCQQEGKARFAPGDLVMHYRQNPGSKLQPRWDGPFRITHVWPKSVQLETLDGIPLKYRHHHTHIRPFKVSEE